MPVVREEPQRGVGGHPYLQATLDAPDSDIPVAPRSDTVANREAVVRDHLDPGEARAFALADAHDGRLLTDDGDARSVATEQGVIVGGPVGVLLAAIDSEKIDDSTADEWLSTWIDDIGYNGPSTDLRGSMTRALVDGTASISPNLHPVRWLAVRSVFQNSSASYSELVAR